MLTRRWLTATRCRSRDSALRCGWTASTPRKAVRVCSISLKNLYLPGSIEQIPAISRVFFLSNTLELVIIPPVFGMSPTYGTDSQACESAGGERYECGMAATRALKEKIAGKPVRCEGDQRDRYGQAVS